MPSSIRMPTSSFRLLLIALLLAVGLQIQAHPIPDVPVRASFDGAGGMVIRIEVDPRCFEADPNKAPSVLNKDRAAFPADKPADLKAKAAAYAARAVQFVLEPLGPQKPEFDFQFTAPENAPLLLPDDIVVLTGTWKTTIPAIAKSYSIKAMPEGTLSVLFFNEARGEKLERFQVLFPGESSYKLDLQSLQPVGQAAAEIVAADEPKVIISSRVVLLAAAVFVGLIWLMRQRAA